MVPTMVSVPLLPLNPFPITPSPPPSFRDSVWAESGGVVEGGIVLIWRGVTTPVNTPNHSDTCFYFPPSECWEGSPTMHVAQCTW